MVIRSYTNFSEKKSIFIRNNDWSLFGSSLQGPDEVFNNGESKT